MIEQKPTEPSVKQGTLFDKAELERLTVNKAEWEATAVQKSIERVPERKNLMTTSSVPVQRLYTPLDNQNLDYTRDLGFPGTYPYTRGVQPTMYRAKPWTMRMFAGFGTAEDTNRRFKYLLQQGQTGLSTAFDMATLYGYDTDHPKAAGEFGKCGVAISSLADMEILFADLPLDKITTSMTINSPAPVLWAMYIANAEKQGFPMASLGGTLQNDILKEYIAQKEFLFPPEPSLRLVVDTIEFGTRFMPKWNTISISGYHIREAGATAVQELAFTLADGLAYVDAALERGLKIDEFAPRLSFFFDVHNDFFEEIAKFRAARRLWARLMKERYGAKDPRSMMLRCHAQTAGVSLTAQQPENNIVRTAIQALAAVLGGTQSLHTNSLDEALALPTEKAALIALRTQQIIAHESGVANVVDPLGGSYFLEELTDQTERAALAYIEQIDSLGGVLACIQNGFFQREIAESAYRYQQEIDAKKRVIVGVNEYVMDEEVPVPTLYVDYEGQKVHLERLNRIRRERDQGAVREALDRLRCAAEGTENTMPFILDAVKAYATLGEIMDVFRTVFGEYMEPAVF
ncbi:methylmalonyl-CoA mutase N-terminal domain/subunit [Thermosporothrix hazakensis]|jgi:methylmalonyl-CoA mutase N-terminal domain/subunit|uniref:Methylmalonyl-CoA mutase N-terminal domain/subunit n=2 Tax=Thermosporothrix TaxID=768650 RepID=A0A326UFR8_THEHA|nr:methylmalonyl-CoA mutase family protein [Thermosporothrix hazakensis]PZW36794.1 methylmalonyl-CoA mutase N-terminal domain/subunit [Thermosporothrix hazakensis]BBH89260.1 methylmalonyl-CoA mutase [Thermosporothrix sp. COM3]GCE47443.1 methylmalonyl-CoA mutase [Thermosporothrix hazakensis]